MINPTHAVIQGSARVCLLLFLAAVFTACTYMTMAAEPSKPENIARGAKYTLSPGPNYSYCTDSGDITQLTDGRSTTEYFWTDKGTVGWSGAKYAAVTVDLGRVEPISGVALTTAAGSAEVTWPAAIHVLVSDDGKTYRNAGDLVALDRKTAGPMPKGYAIRRLITTELATRGRFVQFAIIPLPGGSYMFADEVEVFRGSDDLLKRSPGGDAVTAAQIFEKGRIRRSLQIRFTRDVDMLRRTIGSAKLANDSTRRSLLAAVEEVAARLDPGAVTVDRSFRAVLPLSSGHGKLFEIQAALWRALDRPELSAWVPVTWEPLDLSGVPPVGDTRGIEAHTMLGEYRAAAFNLANASDRPMKVRIRLEGLPGAPVPDYVTLHEVQWTDTSRSDPVAAALPEIEPEGGVWTVGVLPGIVRQVWLTFNVVDVPADEYSGKIVVESADTGSREIPVCMRVWPFEFPERTTLLLGGWSYTDGNLYGVTSGNREAFVKHLRGHFVNSPWATSGVMRSFKFAEGDPSRIKLDTRNFDRWLKLWPDADRYMVFLAVADYSGAILTAFGGAEIGSPQFDKRVATWISAWVEYLGTKGIGPNQLGLLIHDEPHEGSEIGPFLAWSRAIRAAQPEVLIWEDPTYRDPSKAPPELFEACDVLCPNRPMWLGASKAFEKVYRKQKEQGRDLQFYSCSGPARLLDPYSYYRLQAWHCWQEGGNGSYFWAFGDNSGNSSWNEYFITRNAYTPLFIDDESVTPGKQMEAVRESVEDYEYFVILADAVKRAKKAGRTGASVARGESILSSAAKRVLAAENADKIRLRDAKDRTVADTVRVEILEALVSLKEGN
jgi:F5/8 type C domain-containing protein